MSALVMILSGNFDVMNLTERVFETLSISRCIERFSYR